MTLALLITAVRQQAQSKPATARRIWQPFHSVLLHKGAHNTSLTGDGGDTDG